MVRLIAPTALAWLLSLVLCGQAAAQAAPSNPATAKAAKAAKTVKTNPRPASPPAAPPAAEQAPSRGAGKSVEDLAKAAQNPIADMISLPFQNNFNFNQTRPGATQYILNVEPVVPFHLTEDWNLVTRTIIPTISTPLPFGERVTGIGDLNPTLFFSPVKPTNGVIWGAGPVFVLPTASDEATGQGKWSVGPSFVAVKIDGPWVIGALVNNVWSVAGNSARASVNQMTLQPFLNYNMPGGWYLTSSPIITANWRENGDNRWVLPIGGGVGRVFKIGDQPFNVSLAAYYNVLRPDNSADWQLRFQVQMLFPK